MAKDRLYANRWSITKKKYKVVQKSAKDLPSLSHQHMVFVQMVPRQKH